MNGLRRLLQCAAFLVLIFATVTPVVNCFDTWDKGQAPANDTELQVTALFIGAGFVLVLPKLVRRFRIAAVRLQRAAAPVVATGEIVSPYRTRPEPSASPPPVPLRV